jgi:hypothetical protein
MLVTMALHRAVTGGHVVYRGGWKVTDRSWKLADKKSGKSGKFGIPDLLLWLHNQKSFPVTDEKIFRELSSQITENDAVKYMEKRIAKARQKELSRQQKIEIGRRQRLSQFLCELRRGSYAKAWRIEKTTDGWHVYPATFSSQTRFQEIRTLVLTGQPRADTRRFYLTNVPKAELRKAMDPQRYAALADDSRELQEVNVNKLIKDALAGQAVSKCRLTILIEKEVVDG